mmetsp:Transcript_8458/g.9885  ORF Transcript_8458/g.9885 Transcript_8458/m.9885 type:complete len:202 (+) Transcript_8458:569-1174(+)
MGLILSCTTVFMTDLSKQWVDATMTCNSAHLIGRDPLRLNASNKSIALSFSSLCSFDLNKVLSGLDIMFGLDFFLQHSPVLITVLLRAPPYFSSLPNFSNWVSSCFGTIVKSLSNFNLSITLDTTGSFSSKLLKVDNTGTLLYFILEGDTFDAPRFEAPEKDSAAPPIPPPDGIARHAAAYPNIFPPPPQLIVPPAEERVW